MLSATISPSFSISSSTFSSLLLTAVLLGLSSCDFNISRDGSPGTSESIVVAKEQGVFRAEYYLAKPGEVLLPEDVAEAWLETPWSYEGVFGGIRFDSISNQNRNVLIINLSKKGAEKVQRKKINVRIGDAGFNGDWDHKQLASPPAIPMRDTLLVDVITFPNDTPISVGTILFIKK
jgi:hypothetical protein